MLVHLDSEPDEAAKLSDQQKSVLKFQTNAFLGSLSAEEFRTSLSAIKTFGEKAKDFWDRHAGPLAVVLEAVLRKIGVEGVEIPRELSSETRRDESLRYHLRVLSGTIKSLGFGSVYVLVDKVDELGSTSSDAEATFGLIRPLLLDLPTLETPGIGFKFFLWDRIEDAYLTGGGRPDRVQIHHLEWSLDQLEDMLKERLQAHSNQAISSLNQLVCDDVEIDLHRLVAILAAGSPRDMIRTAKRIVAEQTRVTGNQRCLDGKSIWAGIAAFALRLHAQFVRRSGRIGHADIRQVDTARRVGKGPI